MGVRRAYHVEAGSAAAPAAPRRPAGVVCPFAEACKCSVPPEGLVDHGIDAHRLRITQKAVNQSFNDTVVESADIRERMRKNRRWRFMYEIGQDIYMFFVQRKRDREYSDMIMSFGVYRIYKAAHADDDDDRPLRCQVAVNLQDRQGVAFTLNATDALTERRPRRQIPLDAVCEQKMESFLSFPATLCDLGLTEEGYAMELVLKFSEAPKPG